jgi:microcystin-dependent protein
MLGAAAILVEVPVGAVLPYAGPINPCTRRSLVEQGWLVCDGAPVYASVYPELYGVIRRLYGWPSGKEGDAGVFCLPDYRGMFLRGLDRGAGVDPEAAERTPAGPGGTGNKGDQVGSRQGEAIEDHTHTYQETVTAVPNLGQFQAGGLPLGTMAAQTEGVTQVDGQPDITETRPVNVAVNFIIKSRSTVSAISAVCGPCRDRGGVCADTEDAWS